MEDHAMTGEEMKEAITIMILNRIDVLQRRSCDQ
jgi:hypothetical protein